MKPIIVVPYRDRAQHLRQFVPAMRKYFPEAEIVIVEQYDRKPFNRGAMINIGFAEAYGRMDYFIPSDVDMIPIDVDYSKPVNPTHLAGRASQFGYKMPYPEYFGGVNAFLPDHFIDINGFMNSFKNWGAEDNCLYDSVLEKGYTIDFRAGKFKSLPHGRNINKADYDHNVKLWQSGRDWNDGLSSLKYGVYGTETHKDYTLIKVSLEE